MRAVCGLSAFGRGRTARCAGVLYPIQTPGARDQTGTVLTLMLSN